MQPIFLLWWYRLQHTQHQHLPRRQQQGRKAARSFLVNGSALNAPCSVFTPFARRSVVIVTASMFQFSIACLCSQVLATKLP